MKFGDLPSNVEQPSRHFYYTAKPGWGYANGSGGDTYMYNVVMPWTGRVTVEARVAWTWAYYQHIWNWISSGTQGPSFAPPAQTLGEWMYSFETLTVIGAWDSVAAGVDLSIWCHTAVGGGGPSVNCDGYSIDVRLHRL